MEKGRVFAHGNNFLSIKLKPALDFNKLCLGPTINNQLLQEESIFDSGKVHLLLGKNVTGM